jgi:2-C-methyl-D-erythritol 2,4-cyclodiphosphate synthase
VAAKGYRVVNVDAVITAQKPKVMPHAMAMRARLAPVLGVTIDDVSIKATTMEGLGAIGRAEGIAVMAVATVIDDPLSVNAAERSGIR